jgi:tRNA(Ile)-lysidine synthase
LIEVKRREIEAFLRAKKIAPRIDTSNQEDVYFRNKIRNRLMPLLEKDYNKNVKEVLSNTAQSLGYDYDYMFSAARKKLRGSKARLNLDSLIKAHPALRRLWLRMAIQETKGDTRRITFTHIKELEDLIFNRPANSIVHLPKGLSVVKKKNLLFFTATKP